MPKQSATVSSVSPEHIQQAAVQQVVRHVRRGRIPERELLPVQKFLPLQTVLRTVRQQANAQNAIPDIRSTMENAQKHQHLPLLTVRTVNQDIQRT